MVDVERINILNPVVTQERTAVEALSTYLNTPINDGVLDFGTVKLVQSNKGDVYYTVTAKECSCPSFTFRGGPCKHIRKHFAEVRVVGQTIEETLAEHDKNLHKMPKSYQRLVRAAREEAESEEERAAKIAAAKAKCEANRQQARDHQTGQKAMRAESEPSLITRGGFRPSMPEEEPLGDFDRVS